MCANAVAFAQSYPDRSIRLIVPYVPGGNVDITGRIISPGMTEALGVSLVVDNRGGAGGSIGSDLVAKAPARWLHAIGRIDWLHHWSGGAVSQSAV